MNGTAALSSENSLCQRCNKPVLGAPVEVQMGLQSSVCGPSTTQLQPVSAPAPPLPPPPPPPPPLPPPKLPPAPLPLKRGDGSKALLVGSKRVPLFLFSHGWVLWTWFHWESVSLWMLSHLAILISLPTTFVFRHHQWKTMGRCRSLSKTSWMLNWRRQTATWEWTR